MVGADPALDRATPETNSQMKNETETSNLDWLVKFHHIVEMWRGRKNQSPTQMKSRTQIYQIIAVGYILSPEEMFTASWSQL
jgi:hypothetical protein